MLFSLLLVMMLGQGPAAQEPPTQAEAVRLADEGRDQEALEAFQARAAANPNDHFSRVWIARLHERGGRHREAEAVYRSVVLENPDHVEAMTGVGRTLLAQGETKEAIEFLERADRLAPRNEEVLAALGRAYRTTGRDGDAIVYLERAYDVAPTAEQRLRLEDARLAFQHRIELRGFNERFSDGIPDSNGGDIAVNVRVNNRLRVAGMGQVQRKFRISDQRGGGGFEWRWTPSLTLRGQALVGPGNEVLPVGDYLGALDWQRSRAQVGVGYRYFDFGGAWVAVVSPAVSFPVTDRFTASLGYHFTTSESDAFNREHSHSTYARGAFRTHPRLWLLAGYAAGVEDWTQFSIDRIGDFDADTVSVGLRLDLPSLTSITGGYERQWRPGDITMGRITISLAQRF